MGINEAEKRLLVIAKKDKEGEICMPIEEVTKIISEEMNIPREEVTRFLYNNRSNKSEAQNGG